MATIVWREEVIKAEVLRPETRGQVDRYLQAMLYWTRHGYPWTEGQVEQLGWLCELVEEEDDGCQEMA